MFYTFVPYNKKSLKIPKGKSEAVNQKDSQHNGQKTKEKRKTTIYKALHRKLKIK